MEELRRLEQLHKALSFMESRGFVTSSSNNNNNNDECNRFLANVLLLLVQPCGGLDFRSKCALISQHLPNFSGPFLEEASLWFGQEGSQLNSIGSEIVKKNEYDLFGGSNCQDMPMVGLDAMQRANSTLEDFCRSYFMFHGMDSNNPQTLFKYLPVLSFTESYIYQLDSLNERILDMPSNVDTVLERGSEVTKSLEVFKSDPFRPLVHLFEHHGLLTERIREELRCGEEYWALERKLCCSLMSKKQVSVEDVMRAIYLKSFDYRVLNLLLYQLRGEKEAKCLFFEATVKVNDLHMEFLSISEFLVEISDDLFDYEDDVLENNFNILRMFVRIYGSSSAPTMLAKYISEAEEKYQTLLKSLDPQLSVDYHRRCEEATKEGGMISGHPLGTWIIPPAIGDEESYRSKLLNLK